MRTIGIAASIVVFLFIANPVGMYFLNDEFIHIPLATSGNFFHSNLLRPVADISLWIDGKIWGKNALGFHLTNIFLHLLNSLLVYLLCKKLFSGEGKKFVQEKSISAALLFLFYAFHSESIFWIIGRGGSLAALSILVSLNCFLRSKGLISLMLAILSFVIGLYTYEFVFILPLLIIVFQVTDFINGKKPNWYWSIGFVFVFCIYLFNRSMMQSVYFSKYELGALHNFRPGRLIYNYILTLVRCFVPPAESKSLFLSGICLLIVILGIIFIRIKNNGKYKTVIIPLIFFLISCLPSVALGIDSHDTEGERFLYVPSIFFCWLVVEIVFVVFSSANISMGIIVALLLFNGFFLLRSAESYRYAGRLVSGSFECLKQTAPAEILNADSVPTQFRGALIFRMGFENGVRWLMPGKFQKINIRSSKEIINPVEFQCNSDSSNNDPVEKRIVWNDKGLIIIN